jgi:uncharacterized membrane protein YfcA
MPESLTFETDMTRHVDIPEVLDKQPKSRLKWVYITLAGLALVVGGIFLVRFLLPPAYQLRLDHGLQFFLTGEFWLYALVGFLAQMIDGALGMAYGVSSTTFLLSIGLPPAAASASVHMSEVFTTGVSGLSHWKLGNVSRKLFRSLVIPGAIGAVLGATVLSNIDGDIFKPWIALYLLVMGIIIIRKALRKVIEKNKIKNIAPLALFGGFIDAVGGGGWGPVVNSTLIGRGHNPRFSIGSVNTAEFFVAVAGSVTFAAWGVGLTYFKIVIGLMFGGMFAAPFAAYLMRKMPAKTLMLIVGTLIILLSLRTFYMTFFK